jgi:hypothetical protein
LLPVFPSQSFFFSLAKLAFVGWKEWTNLNCTYRFFAPHSVSGERVKCCNFCCGGRRLQQVRNLRISFITFFVFSPYCVARPWFLLLDLRSWCLWLSSTFIFLLFSSVGQAPCEKRVAPLRLVP